MESGPRPIAVPYLAWVRKWEFRLLLTLSFAVVAPWTFATDFDPYTGWWFRSIVALALTPLLALVLLLPFWGFLRLLLIPLVIIDSLRGVDQADGSD